MTRDRISQLPSCPCLFPSVSTHALSPSITRLRASLISFLTAHIQTPESFPCLPFHRLMSLTNKPPVTSWHILPTAAWLVEAGVNLLLAGPGNRMAQVCAYGACKFARLFCQGPSCAANNVLSQDESTCNFLFFWKRCGTPSLCPHDILSTKEDSYSFPLLKQWVIFPSPRLMWLEEITRLQIIASRVLFYVCILK